MEHLGRDVHAVDGRVVVAHDRQPTGGSDRTEMVDRFTGIGVVDHRGQHHEAVGAGRFRRLRRVAGALGRELGHTAEHGNPASGDLGRHSQHLDLLLQRQRAVFAYRAQHHETMNPAIQQGLDM